MDRHGDAAGAGRRPGRAHRPDGGGADGQEGHDGRVSTVDRARSRRPGPATASGAAPTPASPSEYMVEDMGDTSTKYTDGTAEADTSYTYVGHGAEPGRRQPALGDGQSRPLRASLRWRTAKRPRASERDTPGTPLTRTPSRSATWEAIPIVPSRLHRGKPLESPSPRAPIPGVTLSTA